MLEKSQGYVPFRDYETWYRSVGRTDPGKYPVLCLSGGPGSPHDYLEPLGDLAESGRRIIFYDQIGCGRSSKPSDRSLWAVDLFVDELCTLRSSLRLDYIHLLGHSWGGMLAMEYMIRKPSGVIGLVLASALSSTRDWAAESSRLRSELPLEIRDVLESHERTGDVEAPIYQEAVMEYYRRHACRTNPWPDCLERSFSNMSEDVYKTLWGPNEMVLTGKLSDWDVTDQLASIDVPTLITSGRFDECTPVITEPIHRALPNSEWIIFENSSHLAFIEEHEAYLETLNRFFLECERRVG